MGQKPKVETVEAWWQTRWQQVRSAWWAVLLVAALAVAAGLAVGAHGLIEYVRVLLGWPPIVAAIALLFLHRFRDPIARWVEHAQIRTRGGDVIGPQPSGPTHIPGPVTTTTTAAASDEEIAVAELEAEVKRWKFLYYSAFYVQRTKDILAFLDKAGRVPVSTLITIFIASGQATAGEFSVMLDELTKGGMVKTEDASVEITSTGREFVWFLVELGESSPS